MVLPSQISRGKMDTVTVRVKTNLPEIQLVTSRIGPIIADSEVHLDRWQAEILAEWGIVEWPKDSNSLFSKTYVSRDREQEGRSIERIDDVFHVFPELVRALQSEGLLTQKMGAVRGLFEDLVMSRTNKIARAARMGQDLGDQLTPEELWLYRSLRRIFDAWRSETGRLIEAEGSDGT